MGRKRDRFWEYAKELEGRFECNFCDREFAGGISRIKSHLSGVKGRDIDICLKVPDHVRDEAQLAIGLPYSNKKAKNVKHSSSDNEIVIVGVGDNNPTTTSSSTPSTCRETKKRAVDEKFLNFQIANGFFKGGHPRAFVEFLKAALEYGPDYELPDWYTCQKGASTFHDDEMLEYERGVKESWSETGCTLMLVLGEDTLPDDDLGEVKVFAYCPRGTLFLTSGPYHRILDHLVGMIEGIGSHHIVQFIHSHDCFRRETYDLMKESHPRVLSITCPTHQFGSILGKISYCGMYYLLLAVMMVFIYMRKFSMESARKIFDKCLEYKKRLDSLHCFEQFSLLLSMVELESEVKRVVQSLEDTSSSSELAKWVADVIADTKFWTLGNQVVRIFDVLFQVVRLGYYNKAPGFGYLYEAVNKACIAIDECCRDYPTTKNDAIKHRCHVYLRRMITPLHAAASFLNPAIFTSREKFKEDSLMTQGISYIAHDVIADKTDTLPFLDQVQMYRDKVPSIFNAAAVEKLKTVHPGIWWHQFGDSVPVLQKYAIRILSQPCSLPLKILHTKNRICDSIWLKDVLRCSGTCLMEPIDLDEFTRVSEFVKQEVNLTCISEPTDDTFENFLTGSDPLSFWLEYEADLIRWDVT